jgi:hypothetical protein
MARSYSTEYLIKVLRNRVGLSSLRSVAAELGFSAPYLHDVLNYRRQMSRQLGAKLGFAELPPRLRRWTVAEVKK